MKNILILSSVFFVTLFSLSTINSAKPAETAEDKAFLTNASTAILQKALDIPDEVDKLIAKINEIEPKFNCFKNPSNPGCDKLCKDKKECASVILSTSVNALRPAITTLFGNINAKDPAAVDRGIIPLLLQTTGQFFKVQTLLNMVPKVGKLVQTLDLALVYLNGLALALAPLKFASTEPKIELPAMAVEGD